MTRTVLFVCTGNSCRSPMAERLFAARVDPSLGWTGASAGLAAFGGGPASPGAVEALREAGLDASGHRSRPLTGELVDAAALVVVMTAAHRDEVVRRFPRAAEKVRLLTSFGTDPRAADDVPDPVGASAFVYRRVRERIESAVSDLVLHLRERERPARREGPMKIAIGSDHGGFELKERLRGLLAARGHAVEDLGCFGPASVDYPESAAAVARRVSGGEVDTGIVVCTTGIGASMAANKVAGVRAALCTSPHMAEMARRHNDANVLALGGRTTRPEDVEPVLDAWLGATFEGGRHQRRVEQMMALAGGALAAADPETAAAVAAEDRRQRENLELIASENYTSRAIREAAGSSLTNKYAEGYPGKRYYGGCECVDVAERLAIDRAKQLFGAEHANVQPHSGSQANMAVYFAALQYGDPILTMELAHGGHLTHGSPRNFSGRFYKVAHYGVRPDTERIDYDALAAQAMAVRPKMITAGASAYPRTIDFARLREIADACGALLFVDMAHIAGLVAAGLHPSPVPHADFVTTTTHKTLRGPRAGLILCRAKFAKDIDSWVLPGIQGGPLMHIVAAKAVCFLEAMRPEFRAYQAQIVRNAQALAAALAARGFRIVSGGTDNHLMLVDLRPKKLTGKVAQEALDRASITVNKNLIPFDPEKPLVTSGVRIGTPAVTTRGMKEPEMEQIAGFIGEVLDAPADAARVAAVRARVHALTARFPVP